MSKHMMPRFAGFRVLVTALGVLCSFPAFAGDLPQTRNWNDGPPAGEHVRGAVGSSIDGVFGDYVVIDETALVSIPDGTERLPSGGRRSSS